MSYGRISFPARRLLESGEYFNNHGKRDANGLFQDEIVPEDSRSVWYYHGNPIAEYNYNTKEFRLSSCGWKTPTTKTRLNALKIGYISQENFEWYIGGSEFNDADIRTAHELYHRIDGWRGFIVPPFAVLGASDCGTWSDSPAPSDKVDLEFKKVQKIFAANKIKTYFAWTESSNAFMIKRWLFVRGVDYAAAMSIAKQTNVNDFYYIHEA